MPSYAFLNNRYMPLQDARIGVMTHALHYGTAVFEGIRGNWNEEAGQLYLFRLSEHFERLVSGARILRMQPKHTPDELCSITTELCRKSSLREDVYIRPLAYKSTEGMGVRLHNLEDDILIFVIPWGAYLDMETARCAISSWRRPSANTIPPSVKISGTYVNNAFAKTEAIDNGFDEGIMLTPDGYVAEGSGENVFLVKNGKLVTPPVYNNILSGITRNTIMTVALQELGLATEERPVDRVELYQADECFLTGTAAHLTPVSEIDRYVLNGGSIGPVTRQLQQLYFDIIRGKHPGYMHWCTPVYEK